MVRDGIFYGLGAAATAVLLGVLASPWWAVPPALLGIFFLWFFRDPERRIRDARVGGFARRWQGHLYR
jgi:hypothetical protein